MLAPLVQRDQRCSSPGPRGLSAEQFQAETAALQGGRSPRARRRSTTLLPQAFALAREAVVRTLGMRHFDVQLVGGVVLHHGAIAEMMTGEGKTLVATLPLVPERARRQDRSTS